MQNTPHLTIEKAIELNHRFDIAISSLSRGDILSLLHLWKKEAYQNFIDEGFKKYFNLYARDKNVDDASWFFSIILNFVSISAKVEMFKKAVGSENCEILECWFQQEDKSLWKALILSLDKNYQVVWLSQYAISDVSFYWNEKSYNEILEVASSFYMNTFHSSLNIQYGKCFYDSSDALFSRVDRVNIITLSETNIISMINLVGDTPGVPYLFFNFLINQISSLLTVTEIKVLPNLLILINQNKESGKTYKDLNVWAQDVMHGKYIEKSYSLKYCAELLYQLFLYDLLNDKVDSLTLDDSGMNNCDEFKL